MGLPTLKKGSTGPDVVTLQRALGFVGDEVTGRFRGFLYHRLRNRQREAGLPVTGVCDTATWIMLGVEEPPPPPKPKPRKRAPKAPKRPKAAKAPRKTKAAKASK